MRSMLQDGALAGPLASPADQSLRFEEEAVVLI
jgi:hypothetical protein